MNQRYSIVLRDIRCPEGAQINSPNYFLPKAMKT